MRRLVFGLLALAILVGSPQSASTSRDGSAAVQAGAVCTMPTFAGGSFPSTSFPTELAALDFDSDGFPDLAVVNQTSQDVLLLRNDGSGLFTSAGRIVVGGVPNAIAAGDLTGDAVPDLLVNNSTLNTVTVLVGDGAAGFVALSPLPTGTTPRELAIADLDGDFNNDVLTANNGGTVSLIPGAGEGAFAERVELPVGGNPRALAVGDFDENGIPDLAVVRFGASSVSIFKGTGDGAFGTAVNLTVGSSPIGIASGDFNGDAHLDLAVASQATNTVSVLLGNGAGAFGAATAFIVGTSPRDVAAADLSGDGHVDLVTADNAGTVTVLLGDGTGLFSFSSALTSDANTRGVVVTDVNNDNRPDLAVANAGGNTARVFYNTCGGSDVTIQKAHSGNFVVGNEAAFVITVTNQGPDPTSGPITVTDTLPAGLQFHSHFGSRWHCSVDSQVVTCINNDVLAPATSFGFQLNVNVGPAAAPSSTNVVTVATLDDPNPSNNRSMDTALASATANLGITMSESSDPALYNEDLVYTLAVTNYGPSPAVGVELTDVLPTTVQYRSSDTGAGRCFLNVGTTTVRCLLDDIPSGSTVLATILVRPISFSTITNTASVKGTYADPVIANNKATQNTIVIKLASFAILPTVVPGCGVSTGTVTLNGPAPAGGVPVTVTSNRPAAIVPASVSVLPGASSVTFPITTTPVTATVYASIIASVSGKGTTKNLQVRPMGVGQLTLDPATVKGGDPSTATVVLECVAPVDTTVTLTSSSPTAAKPVIASIVIPAGEQTTTFAITTFPTVILRTATFTAAANRIAKTAKLTLTP